MHVLWIIYLFAMAACTGSFLNVIIYRMPRGESIVFPGSHCTRCGKAIRWFDNLPLISWLALRGKCRYCKTSISPRYIIIELFTALMIVGLYVCYYILELRSGAQTFEETFPMFIAHAALLCVLLACSMIDIAHRIVPLEICWVASGIGIIASTASPHQWVGVTESGISSTTGAMAIAAAVGLAISAVAQWKGLILPSCIDVDSKGLGEKAAPAKPKPAKSSGKKNKRKKKSKKSKAKSKQPKVVTPVRKTVNFHIVMFREMLYLAPAVVLAVLAGVCVTVIPGLGQWWRGLHAGNGWASHIIGFEGALYGYLIGGLMIWGTRIIGTFCFGREAMGLGDVHILAAVGAVGGWAVAVLAFFLAPFIALLWAFYLLIRRKQRELPYGPWLAVAALVAMVFYDYLLRLLGPQIEVFEMIF